MAKKKPRYPNRNRNIIIGIVSVIVVAAAIFGISALNTLRNGYIFKLEGTRVSVREYNLFLFNQRINYEYQYGTDIWSYVTEDFSIYDVATENALNSLINTKIVLSKAADYGISASDEDKTEAADYSTQFITNVEGSYGTGFLQAMNLTKKQLDQIMLESVLVDKIYEEMTKSFTPDEADLSEQYNSYLADYRTDYMTVNVNYIKITDLALAKDLDTQLKNGGDFDALMAEHSSDYDAEAEDPMAVTSLASLGVSDEVLTNALDLEPGAVSDFEALSDAYIIFRIASIDDPDYDDLAQQFRDSYISAKKSEMYTALCDEWRAAAKLEIYEHVFERATIPGVAKPTPVPSSTPAAE